MIEEKQVVGRSNHFSSKLAINLKNYFFKVKCFKEIETPVRFEGTVQEKDPLN
jgi:hypothetical protein